MENQDSPRFEQNGARHEPFRPAPQFPENRVTETPVPPLPPLPPVVPNVEQKQQPFYKTNLWGVIGIVLSIVALALFALGVTLSDVFYLVFVSILLAVFALSFSIAGYFFKPRWLGCLGNMVGCAALLIPVALLLGIMIAAGQWHAPRQPVEEADSTYVIEPDDYFDDMAGSVDDDVVSEEIEDETSSEQNYGLDDNDF